MIFTQYSSKKNRISLYNETIKFIKTRSSLIMLLLKKISGHTEMRNNITSIGKEVVKLELNSLRKLNSSIGNTFEKIVKTILNCKNGKIIVSGVGKSGIIAKKWSATLSSTGTPSFFLDASNASHGDMGQITSNDVVILISLSGQSEELKNIIQYVSRNKNIKLIGITSRKGLFYSRMLMLISYCLMSKRLGRVVLFQHLQQRYKSP